MDPKDTLQKLLQELPNGEEFQVERECATSSAIQVTGYLKGRDKDGVVVQSGRRYFVIAENDIVAIDQVAPAPHLKLDNIEVSISVAKGATVKVVAFVTVENLVGHIGLKPLVYDIPSKAHEFLAEGRVVDEAHAQWMRRTGLSDFQGIDSNDTFKTTYYPTYKESSRQTTNLTGTSNNDTQTDYQTDWVTDTFQDPQMDYD